MFIVNWGLADIHCALCWKWSGQTVQPTLAWDWWTCVHYSHRISESSQLGQKVLKFSQLGQIVSEFPGNLAKNLRIPQQLSQLVTKTSFIYPKKKQYILTVGQIVYMWHTIDLNNLEFSTIWTSSIELFLLSHRVLTYWQTRCSLGYPKRVLRVINLFSQLVLYIFQPLLTDPV